MRLLASPYPSSHHNPYNMPTLDIGSPAPEITIEPLADDGDDEEIQFEFEAENGYSEEGGLLRPRPRLGMCFCALVSMLRGMRYLSIDFQIYNARERRLILNTVSRCSHRQAYSTTQTTRCGLSRVSTATARACKGQAGDSGPLIEVRFMSGGSSPI